MSGIGLEVATKHQKSSFAPDGAPMSLVKRLILAISAPPPDHVLTPKKAKRGQKRPKQVKNRPQSPENPTYITRNTLKHLGQK
jgi:hypothetical protein